MKYNCRNIYDNPDDYKELLFTPGYLIYLFTNEVNGKHYVGDTKHNLNYRLFHKDDEWISIGHFIRYNDPNYTSHLYNAMRKYGLENFSIEIIYTGEYDEDLEGKFIEKYDSFYNGYNESLNGKSFDKGSGTTGKIIMNNGKSEKRVKPDEVEYYLSLGYIIGRNKNTYALSDPEVQKKQRNSRSKNDTWNKDISWCNTPEAIAKRMRRFDWMRPDGTKVLNLTRSVAGRRQKKLGEKWINLGLSNQ